MRIRIEQGLEDDLWNSILRGSMTVEPYDWPKDAVAGVLRKTRSIITTRLVPFRILHGYLTIRMNDPRDRKFTAGEVESWIDDAARPYGPVPGEWTYWAGRMQSVLTTHMDAERVRPPAGVAKWIAAEDYGTALLDLRKEFKFDWMEINDWAHHYAWTHPGIVYETFVDVVYTEARTYPRVETPEGREAQECIDWLDDQIAAGRIRDVPEHDQLMEEFYEFIYVIFATSELTKDDLLSHMDSYVTAHVGAYLDEVIADAEFFMRGVVMPLTTEEEITPEEVVDQTRRMVYEELNRVLPAGISWIISGLMVSVARIVMRVYCWLRCFINAIWSPIMESPYLHWLAGIVLDDEFVRTLDNLYHDWQGRRDAIDALEWWTGPVFEDMW